MTLLLAFPEMLHSISVEKWDKKGKEELSVENSILKSQKIVQEKGRGKAIAKVSQCAEVKTDTFFHTFAPQLS